MLGGQGASNAPRRPPNDKVESSSGVLDKVLGLLVYDLGGIVAVDAKDHVTAMQLAISGAPNKHPLNGEWGFEILAPLEAEPPRGGEGIPLQPDLILVHGGGGLAAEERAVSAAATFPC